MAIKFFCDLCNKQVEKMIRVNMRCFYCENCWKNKKYWTKIHEAATPD